MNPSSLPVLGGVLETGASDPIFDALLLSGPAVVLLIGLLGRTPTVRAIAIGYLLVFVGNILRNVSRAR
jgi:hypothetical protein